MAYRQPPRNYHPARVSRERFANPYFKAKKADRVAHSRLKYLLSKVPPRAWLLIFGLLIVFIAVLWLLTCSSLLLVKKIEVRGTVESEQKTIESMAWEQSAFTRWWFFPQNKMFVFDKAALAKKIQDRYALDGLGLKRRLPSTLIVVVKEKPAAATWFEADAYYLVDRDGWIIRPLDAPQPGLPIFYNNGGARISGKQLMGVGKILGQADYVWQQLGGHFSYLNYRQLVVDNDRDTIKIILRDGAMIYVATDQPLDNQFERLDILLSGELKNRYAKLSYIDLRYGDKVYYK